MDTETPVAEMRRSAAPRLDAQRLILLVALYIVVLFNRTFFGKLIEAYPVTWRNAGFLLSVAVVLTALLVFLFTLPASRWTVRPLLALALVASAVVAYYTDRMGAVLDATMLENVAQTDAAEARDLVGPGLVLQTLLLGVVPAILVFRVRLRRRTWPRELLRRAAWATGSLAAILLSMAAFGANWASMLREHEEIRSYANPPQTIYSVGKFASRRLRDRDVGPPRPLGLDARIPPDDPDRELIVLVVGEAARADHFSLNGYATETNPRLAAAGAFSFRNVTSCGTSTAVSVPCMFSVLDRADFSPSVGLRTENVLDVLRRADVDVLWRDNNSSSKGVADRVTYEDFRSPERNTVCDPECRDVGMLAGLQERIDASASKDILIVLHQMGNHGPAYYRRYPPEFERFAPTCTTNELSECTVDEIVHAYDNALLYTDWFLGEVVDLLRANDDRFQTALFYVGDHGESLGEGNVYLHGLPYAFAPETQTRVPAIFWFGQRYEIDREALRARLDDPYDHDFVFHTLLGLMEIETDVYDPSRDMLAGVRAGVRAPDVPGVPVPDPSLSASSATTSPIDSGPPARTAWRRPTNSP